IGPTRLAFWDCPLDPKWIEDIRNKNLLLTEAKMENSIDRIKGIAENPRQTERVPSGAKFQFRLTVREHDGDGDLLDVVLKGLRLLEISGLGGSGSRGYGKVKFNHLECNGDSLDERLENTMPFNSAA
ncbi:MAG: type III-A CRISPR-associated RAMP protein Csm3, partial [Nitrospira sp. SB0661_bin_20]|nr:type III-A CRISPR-associated RAMP protein Csm3 [Nitrospira sp. SB0661_bin_20]